MDNDKDAYCYVGRMTGCRCIGVVVVDNPEHAKDTANTIADAVRSGLTVERMTVADFKASKDSFGCANDGMKMKECQKRGLNVQKVAA